MRAPNRTLLAFLIALLLIGGFAIIQQRETLYRKPSIVDDRRRLAEDLAFFEGKIAEGQWVFGTNAAGLAERLFRLTNDYAYLARAEQLVHHTLTHEETAEAYVLLSSLALTRHDFAAAQKHVTRAAAIAQGPSENMQTESQRFEVALALGDLGAMRSALAVLRVRASVAPFDALVRQAQFLDRVDGNLAAAAELFREACERFSVADDPWTVAWCLTQLELLRFRNGDPLPDVDARLVRITEEVYPAFMLALELRARIAARAGAWESSTELLEAALSAGSAPDIQLERAEVALARGDRPGAQAAWRTYLEGLGAHRLDTRTPVTVVAHVRGLVQALLALGDPGRALTEARNDLQRRPKDPGAHQTLAFLLFVQGRYGEALAESRRVTGVSLNGEEAFVRGASLWKLGRRDEADRWLDHARTRERDLTLRARRVWRERLPDVALPAV